MHTLCKSLSVTWVALLTLVASSLTAPLALASPPGGTHPEECKELLKEAHDAYEALEEAKADFVKWAVGAGLVGFMVKKGGGYGVMTLTALIEATGNGAGAAELGQPIFALYGKGSAGFDWKMGRMPGPAWMWWKPHNAFWDAWDAYEDCVDALPPKVDPPEVTPPWDDDDDDVDGSPIPGDADCPPVTYMGGQEITLQDKSGTWICWVEVIQYCYEVLGDCSCYETYDIDVDVCVSAD